MKISRSLIFNFLILICFLAPQIDITYLISILLFVLVSKTQINSSTNHEIYVIKGLFFFIFPISLFLSYLSIGPYFNKDVLKPILILILIFNLNENLIKFKVNKKLIFLILLTLIVSQLAYVLNIESIKQIIDKFYPFVESQMVWTHRSINDIDFINNFQIRAGGIYRNPNQYSKYINLLYIIFLSSYSFKKATNTIIILLCLFTIILTGSRSGILIFLVINLLYYRKFKFGKKLIYLFSIALIYISSQISLRVFSFISEFNSESGSLINRLDGLNYLINNTNFYEIFIGHFYNETTINSFTQDKIMFDGDLISSLFSFGIIGFVLIYLFYLKIIYKNNNFIILPIFLYGITGGLLQDLGFIILLSIIIGCQKLVKQNENYNLSKYK